MGFGATWKDIEILVSQGYMTVVGGNFAIGGNYTLTERGRRAIADGFPFA
jgi:hypothetical protein